MDAIPTREAGINPLVPAVDGNVYHTARAQIFPDGSATVMVADRAVFREGGWEQRGPKKAKPLAALPIDEAEAEYAAAEAAGRFLSDGDEVPSDRRNVSRAVRRARARVRTLARANKFAYFVTFTLDAAKVDRYDPDAVIRKMVVWLSNRVQRQGLCYILVPERHKDGAIHFHGFINNVLNIVDSGTITRPGGKPRRPRSAADRAAMLAAGGHVVYNVIDWPFGFSTAIELYGEYTAAVSYVCKYIGKQTEGEMPQRIGGRWYYSGGDLAEPMTHYFDLDLSEAWSTYGDAAYAFTVPEARASFISFELPRVAAPGE